MVRVVLLDHRDPDVAQCIHSVLVPAYAQEAFLLRAQHFPPLDRTAADIQSDQGQYLGAVLGEKVVGALSFEQDDEPGQTLISTLVVHPAHQRRGIASALLAELFRMKEHSVFAVATGTKNEPALALYRSFGFQGYRFGTIGPDELPLVKLRRRAASKFP